MEKDRISLLVIFGSILIGVMYYKNSVIDGLYFQSVIHRFLPFLKQYDPLLVCIVFIMGCFFLLFVFSDRSISQKQQYRNGNTNQKYEPDPIVQDVIIRPIVEQPLISAKHQPESLFNTSRSKKKQNTYHSFQPKKKRLVVRNYYDRRNRKRFGW